MFQSFAERPNADGHRPVDPPSPLRRGRIGWFLAFDSTFLRAVARSILFDLVVRAKALGKALTGRRGPSIWFSPAPVGWRMIRSAAALGGLRIAASPDEADLACRFGKAIPGATRTGRRPHINARCQDVSRTHVARTFHRAFGYPLLIDPRRYVGWAVEKSEANGMGDSRLVPCPVVPRPGKSYQKLVDASDRGFVSDLRAHCIGGRVVTVWVERRRSDERLLADARVEAECAEPSDVFDDEELLAIEQFLRLIGLDWGTLDILRNRADRRLYIVDVDRTDIPPARDLPVRDKLASAELLADLLATAAARPSARIPETSRIRRGFA